MIGLVLAVALAGPPDAAKAEKLVRDSRLEDAVTHVQAALRKSQDVKTTQRLLAAFEEALYGIAERDDTASAWSAYLKARPQGRWATRARDRLCALEPSSAGACGPTGTPTGPTGLIGAVGNVSTWPSLDEPARTGRVAADDAALVIGLEDYAFVPDVPFASRDAQAVDTLLRYTVGIPGGRVRTITRGSVEQIRQAAREVGAMLGPGGRLWLFFAGHGAADASTRERILLGDDVRADPKTFRERAVALDELVQLAAGASREQVVLLDTCFAGVGRDGASLTGGTRFAVSLDDRPPTESEIRWAATGADGLSGPFPAARHGAFTYLVVGALRGWADGELDGRRDGAVTLAESDAYVRRMLGTVRPGQAPELLAPAGRAAAPLVEGTTEKAPVR